MHAEPKAPFRLNNFAFAVCLAALIPLCFLGYGTDSDTYGVLMCGISTWHNHALETSRHPGYWVYEAVVYVLATLGGYVLSNLASLAVSATIAWRLRVLAKRLRVREASWLACGRIVTPMFAITATTTMDYNWSLLFLVFAVEAMIGERWVASSLCAALAIGFREANCVVLAGAYLALLVCFVRQEGRLSKRAWKLIGSGVMAIGLVVPLVMLSYRVIGHGFTQATGMDGVWTLKLRAARFVYRSGYVFGPLGVLVIAVAAARWWQSGHGLPVETEEEKKIFWCAAGVVIANLALFFKFPIDAGYLMPACFFFLLMAGGTVFRHSRALTVAMFVALLSLNFVEPHVFEVSKAGAHLHPRLAWGQMVEDVTERRELRMRRDVYCWATVMQPSH